MTEYVAFHGQRHAVHRKGDAIHIRPTHGHFREWRKITEDELKALEPWNVYRARTEKKVERCTCQICGRAIGAKRGIIAHHGYERPEYGYQTSSCSGAKRLPFEVSRDALGEHIEGLKLAVEKSIQRLEQLNTPGFLQDLFVYDRNSPTKVRLVKTDDPKWGKALEANRRQVAMQIKMLPETIEMQQKRYDGWTPKKT